MSVIIFIVSLTLILIVVTGWCVGVWHVVHVIRRRHRLEREAEDREHRKRLAEDFAEIQKQLGEGMSFGDYVADTGRQQEKAKASRL